MSLFVGMFWALFLNDMVGDKNHKGGIIAAVVMAITYPVIIIFLQWVLSYINSDTDTNRNRNSTSYKYRVNDIIEKASQSVNVYTWRCIYSMLMMKDMINTDTNSSNNSSKEPSMIETISPLSKYVTRIQDRY